ncbi:RHS repeat-associated core domain-containing protein [Streptomyces spongiicola]|nr:RHS repeat-associated core domain-containing protein [Streptomyces spongiicola]
MKTRTSGGKDQTLTWDPEGHLQTIAETGKSTDYVYDTEGNRLLSRNSDNTATLYLPEGNELALNADGSTTATRYYSHGGQTIAMRTPTGGFTFLFGDHQGTSLIAVAAVTGQAITRRKQLPFGQLRSEQSTAFGTRGFVGGTNDPSGLTHLGAREYDPALGAFISVDPIIDFADPAQMHAYSYAHNTPLTKSDPDGLRPAPVAGTSDVEEFNWARDRGMRVGYTQRNGRYVWGYHPMKDTASQHRYRAYQANVKAYEAAKASRAAAARAKAQAIARAKAAKAKADAERRKKDGIWGSITGGLNKVWDNTGGKVVSGVADAAGAVGDHFSRHWRDYVNAGLVVGGFLAGAACGATIVCGVGVGLAVGAATYTVSNAGTKNWNWSSFGIQTAASGIGGGAAARYAGPKMAQMASAVRTRVSLWRLERTLDRMRKDVNG